MRMLLYLSMQTVMANRRIILHGLLSKAAKAAPAFYSDELKRRLYERLDSGSFLLPPSFLGCLSFLLVDHIAR